MAYLLDTNVFIQAKNTHYGFDFCPAFWDWLDLKAGVGEVLSVNEVRDELVGGDDELAEWARAKGSDFFQKQDSSVAPSLALIARWIHDHEEYLPTAKFTFLEVADYPLIAYAHAHKHVVVTHERPESSKKKVKIPSVCLATGVEYTSVYSMLRRERARFVLDGPLP